MSYCIVLNANFQYINTIDWKKAITLVFQNKVEVLSNHDDIVSNSSKTFQINKPKIVKLVKMIRSLYKTAVPFSKQNVLIRDGYTCSYCNKYLEKNQRTIDHVIPKTHGGKDTFENCVTSCFKCNTRKGDKSLEEVRYKLNFVPYHPTITTFLQMKTKQLGIGDMLKELYAYD